MVKLGHLGNKTADMSSREITEIAMKGTYQAYLIDSQHQNR